MCTSGFSEFSNGDIASQQITPLPSSTSGFSRNAGPSIEPAVDYTTPASPIAATNPLASSTSGFSNNAGPSIPSAVGSAAPASPFAATTPLGSGGAGFPTGNFGSSLFGSTTPSQSSPFGGSMIQQPQSAFGDNPLCLYTPFGAPNQPSFGSSNSPGFRTTNTPAFSAPTTSAFGAATTSAFGSQPTSTFGSGGGFRTPTFGSTRNPAFGATSAASTFGTSTAPAFGAQPFNLFGSSPAFGQTKSGFGSSPFGSTPSDFGSQSSSFVIPSGFQAFPGASGHPGFKGGQQQRGGSRVMAYTPTVEANQSTGGQGYAQDSAILESISAMAVYKEKSPDELRWEDYQLGDKEISTSGFTNNAGPSIQPAVGSTTPASPSAATDSFFGGVRSSSPFCCTPSQPSPFNSSSLLGFSTTVSPSIQPAVNWTFIPSPSAGFVPTTSVFDIPPFGSHVQFGHNCTFATLPQRLLSISAMPVFKDKSHEELRWIDYQVGDKGNSAFGSAPLATSSQPLSWGGVQSSIFPEWGGFQSLRFGSPSPPSFGFLPPRFGVCDSTMPVSATPYIRPRWGSRVASYTPTVELDQAPHYPQLGGEKQINVPMVDKVEHEGKQLDASRSIPSPAEPQDKENDEQMDKKKMQDYRKVVELESEVERCVSVNVPKVDKVENAAKQLDANSSTQCLPAEPQDKENGEQMDKKKMQDLRKAIELECEVERRVSVKHIAFLNSMLDKIDSLTI